MYVNTTDSLLASLHILIDISGSICRVASPPLFDICEHHYRCTGVGKKNSAKAKGNITLHNYMIHETKNKKCH